MVGGDKKYNYIVFAPATGPIMAYEGPTAHQKAHDHARSMLGVTVMRCEVRTELPPELVDDVYIAELEDFDDDETPVDELPPLPPTPADKRR